MDPYVGQTVSHYRILERIGEGGMGVVYRARDSHLGRDVALKVLHKNLLQDSEARRRFRREARTLSRLSHPNIATIFDFESEGGNDILVMELLEGATLADRIAQSEIAEREIIHIGVQIAEALEEAHAKRLLHRDLKPSNVWITPRGHIKVLDFGLAKLLPGVSPDETTETGAGTGTAIQAVMGTLPYMAPEQLRGEPADERTDLYALGVLLYQTATGRIPFWSSVGTALIDEILNKPTPPPGRIRHALTRPFEDLVLRAMEKDPAIRFQTAADLKSALLRLEQTGSRSIGAGETRGTHSAHWWHRPAVLVGAIAVLAGAAWIWGRSQKPALVAPIYEQVTFSGNATNPAIAPDGRSVAYVESGADGRARILISDRSGSKPLPIFEASRCFDLRWSPNGTALGCIAGTDSGIGTFLVPPLGGVPRRVVGSAGSIAWSPDGTRIVSVWKESTRLVFTNVGTGDTTSALLTAPVVGLTGVDWRPDGAKLVVAAIDRLGTCSLWTTGLSGGDAHKLFEESDMLASPRWSSNGRAIYVIRSTGGTSGLCKLKVDKDATRLVGGPTPIDRGIQLAEWLSLSRTGAAAVTRETRSSNLVRIRLGPQGAGRAPGDDVLTTGTFEDVHPSVSPDGKSVAFSRLQADAAEIFTIPLSGGAARQVTFLGGDARAPAWAPDGRSLAFIDGGGGRVQVWIAGLDTGTARRIPGFTPGEVVHELDWAPGRAILAPPPGHRNVAIIDPETGRTRGLLADTTAWVFSAHYAPDGDRVVFQRNQGARRELWVASVSDTTVRRVYDGSLAIPTGWSNGGRSVIAVEFAAPPLRVVEIDTATGRKRSLATLPAGAQFMGGCVVPGGREFVCALGHSSADVWVTEHFDPEGE